MKLLDTMILLSDFKKDLTRINLETTNSNLQNTKILNQQKKYFTDTADYDNLQSSIDKIDILQKEFDTNLKTLNDKIYKQIREKELQFLQRDYKQEEQEEITYQLTVERFSSVSTVFTEGLLTQILSNVDWRLPGLDLNPGDGRYIRNLLAMDPLYAYINDIEVATANRQRFNEFFAERRLRIYDNLDNLPQGQFGLIQAIHMFEFMTLDAIKEKMKAIHNLLRPGGICVFTFNNCESSNSLDMCSNGYRTYCTKQLIQGIIQVSGLDAVAFQEWQGTHDFAFVKKPGELETIKTSTGMIKLEENIDVSPIHNELIG